MTGRPALAGYLTAEAVSITGTRVSMIAIPWFVLTSTGSATRTGLVAFAEMGPLVLSQALSGPVIDRIGPRRIAIGCDTASVLAVGLIPLLHALGALTFPALLVLVAVAGSLRGPADAAKHALLPDLIAHAAVPTERATGLAGAVERTASLVGAAVAGVLVAGVGAANALVVDAASFLVSAVVLTISVPAGRLTPSERDEGSYRDRLRVGWDFMSQDPVLMGIGVMVAVTNLLDQSYAAVLVPVWARQTGNGVVAVGIIGATFGAAALAGSLVAATVAHRLPRFKTYLLAFLLAGLPRFVVLAVEDRVVAVVGVCAVAGLAAGFLNPILAAVLFERIPAPLMGRVSAMNIAMSWSLMPLGGILGGVLVAGVGINPALLAVGAAYFVATMLPAVQPRWRELDDRPVAEEALTSPGTR